MRSRGATAVLGIVLSLGLSAAIYYYTGALFVFLLVPFVPLLFRGLRDDSGGGRQCPRCGFRSSERYDYCPHDGTRLE